ncbi:hypothetical protein AAG747_03560 [Rapidithrix thailandica]|uniref:DUF304 domain-containing protein n=1 Tax=Rapidithrix thailandica TaxID=413964 RepID=A0AAW9RZZ0_9BACT
MKKEDGKFVELNVSAADYYHYDFLDQLSLKLTQRTNIVLASKLIENRGEGFDKYGLVNKGARNRLIISNAILLLLLLSVFGCIPFMVLESQSLYLILLVVLTFVLNSLVNYLGHGLKYLRKVSFEGTKVKFEFRNLIIGRKERVEEFDTDDLLFSFEYENPTRYASGYFLNIDSKNKKSIRVNSTWVAPQMFLAKVARQLGKAGVKKK